MTGLYDFKKDVYLGTNVSVQYPEITSATELRLKAFIQQYNNRMIDDNLTIEGPQAPGVKK
ncbi:MAG: hypothetical protein K2U26_02360 [Cyclobacteriaceae bacterium]|nr:hypothetical protein [Cyclobacteriaceae bacterium]